MALNVCPDCGSDCNYPIAAGPAIPVVHVCPSGGGDGATHGVTAELACITDDATCEVKTVQIIKRIALADGNIDTVRIFSVDGETEIPLPLPDGQSLGPCADALPPLQFCFTDSTTEDVPGRQYDLSFDLAQGFAVEALLIDLTEFALNIAWEVTDPDASEFSADLQAAIQSQFPGATVTVTPPAITTTCGAPETFSVHIECLSLDEDPPTLVQLRYNAGRDLIQNPAYNETPPVADCDNFGDPVPGFHLIRRQDNGGTLDCTSVANRGWETNDDGETFELWCESVTTQQQVVPTPRGTPVQEINSDGNPSNNGTTIWQTFSVPAAGNFIVEMVHGARDAGETHTIRLSTGDTDDTGIGDIINNVTMPPQVTNNGGNPPNPWTVFNQTVPLPAGTFTFSLHSTSPVFQNRGGLFTDMRVYQDVPGEIADFVNNDETCTVEQTSTTTICEHWQPRACNGVIGSWRNVETNEILTDAEFWAQVPSPECCTPEVQDGGGGGGGNLMSAQLVCGIVGGIPTTLIRETIYNPSGGAIDQKFIGPDGAPLTPDDWEPGPCPADSTIPAEFILCDDNGQFIRKFYQNANGVVTRVVNITLEGQAYTPVGTVSNDCLNNSSQIVQLCDFPPGLIGANQFIRRYIFSNDGELIGFEDMLLDGTPYTVQGVAAICEGTDTEQYIVCDPASATTLLIRHTYDAGGIILNTTYWNIDGTGPVAPAGPIIEGGCCTELDLGTRCYDAGGGEIRQAVGTRRCEPQAGPPIVTWYDNITGLLVQSPTFVDCNPLPTTGEFILCDDNGSFIRKFVQDFEGNVTNIFNLDLEGQPYTPVGEIRLCVQEVDSVDCGEEGEVTTCEANQVNGTTTYHDSSDPDGEVTVTVAGTQRTINIHFSPDPDAGNLDGNLEDWLDALDAAMTSGNVVRISFTGGTGATFPQTFVTRGSRAVSYSATNLGDESFEIVIVDDLATVDDCEGIDALYDQERSATPVTFQILDAEFSQFEEDETVTPGEETRSAMLVSVCGNIEVPFYQAICLQDSINTQFLRVIRVDPETSLTEVIGDYAQDFSSTYAPVGATRACEASPAFVGEFILCDENGSFIRKYMQDINGNVLNLTNLTLAGQPYTPVGTVENCNTSSGNTVAEFILCDDDGSFLRKYYQDETGAVIAIVNLTLDGNPYNPVGTVNLCELSVNFTKPHFAEFILCDDNGHFLRKFRQDDTGAIVKVLNFTLEGTSYTPVGTVERCSDCCPTIIGEGCYDDGNGVERFTSIRNEDGTVTLYSQLDGSIVSPGNVVSCDVEVESTIQRLTGAGSINVPAGARSVSVTVVSGNPTVQISGGAIVTLVPGYSPTWSVVEAEETLSDSFNFVGVAGSDFYVLTTREA